jgi:hypothetical protein
MSSEFEIVAINRHRSRKAKSDKFLVTEMVVIKHSINSEHVTSWFLQYACDFPNALDSELVAISIRTWNQNFEADIGSNGRALTAENQCTIHCDVAGESALYAFLSVIPVKDDWKSQPVPHCDPGCRNIDTRGNIHQ